MRGTHTLDGQVASSGMGLVPPLLRRTAPLAALVVALGMPSLARADMTLTFTTTPNGGNRAPVNDLAAWIELDQGPFIKTIGVYTTEETKINLIAWRLIAGPNDTDALLGPSRPDNLTPVTVTWNLRDKQGNLVPDGTYKIRLEFSDGIAQTTQDNRQGAFTFIKSSTPQVQTGLTNNGFIDASIDFQPVLCSNGVVDPGETCDSAIAGSCPSSCAVSEDACMPNTLQGDAVTCSAACTVQPITTCVSGDGCCAPGCTAADDNDCEGIDQNNVGGGCNTAGGSGLAFAAFGFVALLIRRRSAVH